jgi:hypothetical protein
MSPMLRFPRATLVSLALVLVSCGAGTPRKPAESTAGSKVASAKAADWGGPVPAPDDERSVRSLLRAAALDRPAEARASCARFVVAMPALSHGLASGDPMLDRVGLERVADMDTPDGRRRVPILIFTGEDALLRLLGSPSFAELARRLANGYIRPASELERKLVYDLVGGFERGEKITVAQTGALRVAFLLDHGHVFWMELLSAWQPSEWARRAVTERLASLASARVP